MINIKNLTKTYNYKKANAFTALTDVSLTVEDLLTISRYISCPTEGLQKYAMKRWVSSCRTLRW